MARLCCLRILNTQWRQVAGVPAPEWRLESCALPLGWGPRKLPKPTAFAGINLAKRLQCADSERLVTGDTRRLEIIQ
jgi:hypothetical protein